MHEYSIVMALIEQCESLAKQHNATAIARVEIKVGILSGVEPNLLAQAFKTFKLDSLCANAQLNIQIQPLVLACNGCKQQSEPLQRTVLCPQCGSADTRILDGEDMMLMQLEMDTNG